MTDYAWVLNGEIQRLQAFDGAPDDLPPAKGAWLPAELTDPETPDHTVQAWQIGEDFVRRIWTVPAPDPDRFPGLVAQALARISDEFERRSNAPIKYTVGGVEYQWGGDADARENIMGVVILIAAGVPVDNPRPWTPQKAMTPVMITHAELIGLGAALATRKDALYVAKKALSAAVLAATTEAELEAVDIAAGWP